MEQAYDVVHATEENEVFVPYRKRISRIRVIGGPIDPRVIRVLTSVRFECPDLVYPREQQSSTKRTSNSITDQRNGITPEQDHWQQFVTSST